MSGCIRGFSGGWRVGFFEEIVDKRIVKIVNNELMKCLLGKIYYIMYNLLFMCF